MPQRLTGLRQAHSLVSPTGAEDVTQAIDFDLSLQEAIEILGVLGIIDNYSDASPADGLSQSVRQSLHIETGQLETDTIGTDFTSPDSEVFYQQSLNNLDVLSGTGEGVTQHISPSDAVWYPPGMLFSTRNLTHRGKTYTADVGASCLVLVFYRIVKMNAQEFLLHASRRQ